MHCYFRTKITGDEVDRWIGAEERFIILDLNTIDELANKLKARFIANIENLTNDQNLPSGMEIIGVDELILNLAELFHQMEEVISNYQNY